MKRLVDILLSSIGLLLLAIPLLVLKHEHLGKAGGGQRVSGVSLSIESVLHPRPTPVEG